MKTQPTLPSIAKSVDKLSKEVAVLRKEGHIRGRQVSAIDQRLKKVEVRQMISDEKVLALDQKVTVLGTRIYKTDRNVRFLTENVTRVEKVAVETHGDVKKLMGRFDSLEKSMARQFAEQAEMITSRLDRFLGLYEKYDVEIVVVKSSIARHERITPALAKSV
jgi:uncharacterized coiled-coil protein SlyX